MRYTELLQTQRHFFAAGNTKPLAWRLEKLRALQAAVRRRETEILEALRADLGKAPCEAYMCEVGQVLEELRHCIGRLRGWAKPKRVPTPLVHFPAASRIYSEPYGVALLISPWNYPFLLSIAPVIGAVAAGNCFVLKPSEYSANCSRVLELLITEVFEAGGGAVVQGGSEDCAALLRERFDYIFFTGSTAVGKVVMEAAAKHLTPLSLELGGKSPCIVDETADIPLAAKRLVWGKFLNAGQTCVAPDYWYVQESVLEPLLREIRLCVRSSYGDTPLACPDYPRIISGRHFRRVRGLLAGETVLMGGESDPESLKIAPTLLGDVGWDSPVMQEEIFGPILPVLTFGKLEEAVSAIGRGEKPLALYLFTNSRKNRRQVLGSLSFGGGCVNDTVVHLASPYLPFGGVGGSGLGNYHGIHGFRTFSHQKSIMTRGSLPDLPLRYAPYGDRLKWLRRFMG